MAIRTINYTVSADGISPSAEQTAGLRGEHAVTELKFTLSPALYAALLEEKAEGERIVYRFDCFDSVGCPFVSDTAELADSEVTFTVGEQLTRAGGRARLYLVISRLGASEQAETELFSFPARLYFESVPSADTGCGEPRASLSALGEAAKTAAELAAQSAAAALESQQAAETAQEKTELAKRALEEDSEFVFDGGDAEGYAEVEFVIDPELSAVSGNAVANCAVTEKINELEEDISGLGAQAEALDGRIDVNSAEIEELDTDLQTFENSIAERTAIYQVSSGTDGIWSWRKWSDGTAECWGVWSGTLSPYAAINWGNCFETMVQLPQGLFISAPVYTYISRVGTGSTISASYYSSSETQLRCTAISERGGAQTCGFHIMANGKWKN